MKIQVNYSNQILIHNNVKINNKHKIMYMLKKLMIKLKIIKDVNQKNLKINLIL